MVDVEIVNSATVAEADHASVGDESLSLNGDHAPKEEDPATDTESNTQEPDQSEETAEENGRTDSPTEATEQPNEPNLLSRIIKEFLDGESIEYTAKNPDQDTILYVLHLSGKNGTYKTVIDVKPILKRVIVFVECPVKVPEGRRSVAAEFLMHVNFSLAIGTFELDFRDGEVRSRNSIQMNDGILTLEMVRSLVMVPAATMDRFFSGLMVSVRIGMSARVCVYRCETFHCSLRRIYFVAFT